MKYTFIGWGVAVVAAIASLGFNAHAQNSIVINQVKNGTTSTCSLDPDAADPPTPGLTTGVGVVCTNDEAQYKVAYAIDTTAGGGGPATDAVFQVVLPATLNSAPAGQPTPFRWSPSSSGLTKCRNAATAISADGRTLTCLIRGEAPNPVNGPFTTSQAGDLFFDVLTTKTAKNGDTFNAVSGSVGRNGITGSGAITTPQATTTSAGLQIIAQPRADLYKVYLGLESGVDRPAACGASGVQGLIFRFAVGLNLGEIKGHEALQPGWSYTDNVSGIGTGACIFEVRNWNATSGQTPWPPTGPLNPSGINTGGGTYTAAGTAGASYTITSGTGANEPNTSGEVVGQAYGFNKTVALHEVRVWMSVADAQATGFAQNGNACDISITNSINTFDPNGLSGTSNFGVGTEPLVAPGGPNTVTQGPIPLCSGFYEKLYTSNSKGSSKASFQTPPRMTNETAGPNDFIDTYVYYGNSGVINNRASQCDKWDRRKLKLDLLDPAVHNSDYGGPLGATSYYQYKTVPAALPMTSNTTPGYAHIWTSSSSLTQGPTSPTHGEIEYGYIDFGGANAYDEALARSTGCNDAASTLIASATASGITAPPTNWVTQSYLIANPTIVPLINAYRMKDVVVRPGGIFQIFSHFTTVAQNNFSTGTYQATGPTWPDGTIIPNHSSFQSDSPNYGCSPAAATWCSSTTGFMGNSPLAISGNPAGAGGACDAAAQPGNPGFFCRDSYNDRLRLQTETATVRKGIAGSDPNGGPLSDTPIVQKAKGDIITYQLWPYITSKSASVTINNDVILEDTLPPGMKYVAGSAKYNGNPLPGADVYVNDLSPAASTLKFRVPGIVAQPSGSPPIPPLTFEAEVMLDDPLNVGGRNLENKVVIDACQPGASINAGTGAVTCSSQIGSQTLDERTAKRTAAIASVGALLVQKSIIGGDTKEIESSFTMGLRYLNAGSTAVDESRLIDILPYNGEPDRGNPDAAIDKTSFNGTRPITNVVTANASSQVYYTTTAPGSIDFSAKCASNTGGPLGGGAGGPGAWPTPTVGVPPVAGCVGAAGATTWVAATGPAPTFTGIPANATAILIVDRTAFPAGAISRLATMTFSTPGSKDLNRYSNNFIGTNGGGAAGGGATFSVFSNNVTARVFASSIRGVAFDDLNGNGGTTGYLPAEDTGIPGVTMTLKQGATTVGTALTTSTAIPAGQYYNPATGASEATASATNCLVPAGGLPVGGYLFCQLKAGTYAVEETQPALKQTTGNKAGSAGGTVGATGGATEAITAITLPANTKASGYDFGERPTTFVAGNVYLEKGTNNAQDATDTALTAVAINLTCTAPAINLNTTTAATAVAGPPAIPVGGYRFDNLPVGATGCVITETQPTLYASGYTNATGNNAGGGVTNATGATGAGATTITFAGGLPAAGSPNNNFAEVGGTLAGKNYDRYDNSGIGGQVMSLSGNRADGTALPAQTATTTTAAIPAGQFYNPASGAAEATASATNCPVPAGGLAAGGYLFCGLPMSDATGYTVTQTSAQPANTTNGALTPAPAPAPSTGGVLSNPGTTGALSRIANATILPTSAATRNSVNNDFPEDHILTFVSGRVFHENTANSVDDGNASDPGIVTQVSIACTNPTYNQGPVTTNSDGTYTFGTVAVPLVPAGANCTVTEVQPVDFANAYTSQISNGAGGAQIPAAALPSTVGRTTLNIASVPVTGSPNNSFAEVLGSVSGRVYNQSTNEGIGGQTITLAGTSASGANVNQTTTTVSAPTAAGALCPGSPALNVGEYYFCNIPVSNGAGYTVNEPNQPASTNNGTTTQGSTGGVASNPTATSSRIVGLSIGQASLPAGNSVNNNFGEIPLGDMSVTKGASVSIVPGPGTHTLTYTVTVTNHGLAEVTGASVTDTPGANLTINSYTCAITNAGVNASVAPLTGIAANAGCPAASTPGNLSRTDLGMRRGAVFTYTLNATISGATSNVINNVSVALPGTVTQNPASDLPNTAQAVVKPGMTLGDTVFEDLNNNGVRDAGEPGVENVTVRLYNAATNAPLAVIATDGNGLYKFEGLLPATYYVELSNLPPGFTSSTGTNGSPTGPYEGTAAAGPSQSDDGVNDRDKGYMISPTVVRSVPITLPASYVPPENLTVDFGLFRPAKLGDRVFQDSNGDGIQTAGEPGIAGVVVNLLNNAGAVIATTTTDGTGNYLFNNLVPGTYSVQVVPPAGSAFSPKAQGGNAALDSNINPTGPNAGKSDPVTLTAGESNLTVDAGILTGAGLGDKVFDDLNGNGIQDAGEPGVAGVTVKLLKADGTPALDGSGAPITATTNATGDYFFANLPAGSYIVEFSNIPAGSTFTTQDATGLGATDANDSDANPSTGRTAPVTLAAGETNRTVDAGIKRPGYDLTIDKTVSAAPAGGYQPGQTLTFTVVAKNLGPGDTVSGWTITDNIPSGFTSPTITSTTFLPASGAGSTAASCSIAAATLTCTGTTLFPANAQVTVVYSGTIAAGTTGKLTNSAMVKPNPIDATREVIKPTDPNTNNFDAVDVVIGPVTQVSGSVYVDKNKDGVKDPTDTPIAGVTIQLKDSAGAVVATTTTDASGNYNFPNVVPGNYTITEVQPAGYGNSPAAGANPSNNIAITVPATGLTNQNFGETLSAVSGSVYVDTNDNGTKDAGEAPIAGVTVTLTGTDVTGAPVNRTTTTDASGNYRFDDLKAGTYTVTETQPSGFTDGKDTAGPVPGGTPGNTTTNDAVTGIVLPVGTESPSNNFGEKGSGTTVSGSVYVDKNQDGVKDPTDTPIAGVTIQLKDPSGAVVATTTTDANGNYVFNNVTPGNYTITEVQPAGYANSPAAGANPSNNIPITVPTGGLTNQNFGETLSAIRGSVYIDANDNGVKEAGEAPIAGVTVTLTGTDVTGAAVTRTTTTDGSGNYSFDDLKAGTYTVTETQPAGSIDGKDTAGTVPGGTPGNTTTNDVIAGIQLPVGTVSPSNNFGERTAAPSVSGSVYVDKNKDGVKDPTDTPIAGVTIQLKDPSGAVIATTTTDANGNYVFPNVTPGNYTITEVQPAGYGNSPAAGANPSNNIAITVPATGLNNQNFGETLSSISGSVYVDANDNGVKEAGEAPIAGVTVTLTGTDVTGAPVTRTTTTDASGNYTFADLKAGTYTVTETQPAGSTDGKDTAGPVPGGTPGSTTTNDAIGGIQLPAGTDSPSNNFGERSAPASVSGSVYVDKNKDGVKDPTDTPIAGVTIQLKDAAGNVVATTTTDANGNYSFPNVTPGNYTITEVQPAGYGNSPAAGANPSNNIAITVPAGGLTNQNFGETLSSISGSVYVDANDNGVRETGEAPIAGVTVRLTGTDVTGAAVTRTATTDANGNYSFPDLKAGTYTVTETQPAGATDGKDTAGPVPGGTPGNTTTNDVIAGIQLPVGTDSPSNNFGEKRVVGSIEGIVWRDTNHNRILDGGEQRVPGFKVELLDASGNVVATTVTDANGVYKFNDVPVGTYGVRFRDPGTNEIFAGVRPTDPNPSANGQAGQEGIINIRVGPGVNVVEQNLPLDPAGIVYDSVTRRPVAGATVTISGPPGFDPALHLIGGATNATQTTGTNGAYAFLLLPNAPVGIYTLTITPPGGYNTSTIGPTTTLTPPNRPGGPFLVQPNSDPPAVGQSTIYHLTFNLNATTSQDVLNNHIPVDPRAIGINPVPTMSGWAMMMMALLIGLVAAFRLRRNER